MTPNDPTQDQRFLLPRAVPAIRSGNPILDEIDQAHSTLSPGAQAAIAKARLPLSGGMPESMSEAPMAPARFMPTTPKTPLVAPQSPSEAGHTAEFNRLTAAPPTDPTLQHTKTNTGASGVDQIHNPFLRTLAKVGSIAEGTFFPRAAMLTPGTDLHHNMLVRQQAGIVKADQGARAAGAEEELHRAQAAEQESLPELHQTQADLAQRKENEAETAHRNTEDLNRVKNEGVNALHEQQVAAALAQHGFKKDPTTGEIVPLGYEEMSEPMQAIHDLKAAQSEQAQATAALKKAQAENAPAAAKLAQARLQSAQEAHSIASRRLGLSEQQFEMRAFGTNKGEALPGSLLTDENKPVGSAFQQNVRPTGQERNKADLANSAHEQLQDIKSIVSKRPDIFGPAAGRKTDFTVWVGSQDPDAQAFRAARTIAGDHLAGVFGGRSEAALQALDSAIGHFKDNPAALQAGLEQLDKANTRFIKAGTPRTTGSDRMKQEQEAGDMVSVQMKDGRTGQIHSSQKDAFLRDNPGSKVVTSGGK